MSSRYLYEIWPMHTALREVRLTPFIGSFIYIFYHSSSCSFSFTYQSSKLCLIKKYTKLNQILCLIKSSEIIFIFLTEFYLIIWLMPSSKNFLKIPIFRTWQLVFFWGIKAYFSILPLKWWHENINILIQIPYSREQKHVLVSNTPCY